MCHWVLDITLSSNELGRIVREKSNFYANEIIMLFQCKSHITTHQLLKYFHYLVLLLQLSWMSLAPKERSLNIETKSVNIHVFSWMSLAQKERSLNIETNSVNIHVFSLS